MNIMNAKNLANLPSRGKTLVVQKWEESERGWGTRPDGYSLHLSEADLNLYVAEYWARMPKSAPHEYSRPDGTAYIWQDPPNDVYEAVKSKKNGMREWSNNYPGDGGRDGWVHAH